MRLLPPCAHNYNTCIDRVTASSPDRQINKIFRDKINNIIKNVIFFFTMKKIFVLFDINRSLATRESRLFSHRVAVPSRRGVKTRDASKLCKLQCRNFVSRVPDSLVGEIRSPARIRRR
ncbi:hypothetical protein PUN28_015697 [Cardiocondyla obscurior]|uniref:Uncharacterized protein n=1 Tax=Cardiocondyla obscurior TaxID=286306 RepID=A0AAW2EY31_9HYME